MERQRPSGLSRNRFCKYMKLNRSSLYYQPKGESEENLEMMRIIDKYHTEHPTTGVVHMRDMLRLRGYSVNEKRVRRLMRKMDILVIYPQRSLSKGTMPSYVHPYLLRGLKVERPNQVWSTDVSYIPMEKGFMYLYAVIDVYSRFVVGWKLSNTLSANNCIDLMKESIEQYGCPEIINSDQGVQYTSKKWVELLEEKGIRISMDGKGRCKDNIWIERFWRSIKQEYIYLNPADTITELRQGIGKWIKFYNYERPHQSITKLLPAMEYGIVVAA
ncbi:IS3 family transposase ISAzo18 [Porphyromonas levii]|uniref:IS3 family transposase n=2 Tax=Porphyromonas levii TaxID=28114 RepID=UPI001BA4C72B|nr:IS3 family transposase [Porphyromonas levii]MBR8764706.1 IS3 family transposase ISAzo18 [Porphyromonas levii]